LLVVWAALLVGIFIKIAYGPAVKIDFLIFFGLAIPLIVFIINLVPYSFYRNWITLCVKFKQGAKMKENLKVHIRNFDPWKDLSKKHNRFQFSRPFYDFERAHVLESDDILIIYGLNDAPFSFYNNTLPFGVCLRDTKPNDPDLYLVELVSISRAKEYTQLVFTDFNYVASGQITLKIYSF